MARRAKGKAAAQEAKAKKETVRVPGYPDVPPAGGLCRRLLPPRLRAAEDRAAGGQAAVTYNGMSAPLGHWHYDVFTALETRDEVLADTKFNFQGDVNGNVASVSASMEPAVKDAVFEKKPDAKLSDPAYLQQFVGEYELAGVPGPDRPEGQRPDAVGAGPAGVHAGAGSGRTCST